jgi:hypothetical protein
LLTGGMSHLGWRSMAVVRAASRARRQASAFEKERRRLREGDELGVGREEGEEEE